MRCELKQKLQKTKYDLEKKKAALEIAKTTTEHVKAVLIEERHQQKQVIAKVHPQFVF